jgi:TolB-like protein/DNA-binding winged helix-turn-helix (wHTH) protein/Tfp pilus assembly protein PilF
VATPAAEISLLRFGVFELDLRRGELRRAGMLLKLSPQQFRVLRLLAERPGQLCTREEIQREIWGGETFVDFDRGLNVCVAAIRAALHDDSEAPRFIQTVPRQGYRFVAPVEPVGTPAPAPEPVRRLNPHYAAGAVLVVAALIAGVLIFAPGHTAQLVVLPFENLSGRDADNPTAAGLTDELTTQLGSADPGRLAVIGRTSAARYAARKAGLAEVRRDLGVQYAVEGAVQVEDGQARVSVRLIDAASQTQVWSGTYQNSGPGRLAFQETVAANVARAVEARLFPNREPAAQAPYSADEEAREAYWNGRYLDRRDPARALGWFEKAIERDPKFAAAHAAMAEMWLGEALTGAEQKAAESAFVKAKTAAQDALRLDERNAEAHNVLGAVLMWHDWNRAEARRHLQRALMLNPSLARAHHDYGFLLVISGNPAAGIAELRTALALDPLAPRVNLDAGWVFLQARRFDEAIHYARRALEIEPRIEEARACIARSELYQGKAGPAAVEVLSASPNSYSRAMGAAMTGRASEAFAELEEALRTHSSLLVMLPTEPAFDKLRGDARFRDLERRMGTVE